MKRKPMTWLLAICICLMCTASMQVYAEEQKPQEPQQEDRNDPCSIYGKDSDAYYTCVADRKASVTTSDFVSGALYSQNKEIRGREIEMQPDYIKNFSNSNQVAIAYGMSIWDWDTILMHLIGVIIKFFEMIGGAITLVVMVLFNFSSTSFWQETVNTVFATIDQLVFNWENPDSIFMKFIVFAALFAIIQKLVKNFKHIFGLKEVLQIVVSTVLAATLVVGIARYGKPVMNNIETMTMSFVADTIGEIQEGISEDGDTYEISMKKTIFEVMQLQGFRLRHFGVTDVDQIKGENKEERFQTLLNDPSQENAKKERVKYKSTDIIYNSAVAANVLMLSLIFLIHRVLLAIVIGSGAFLVTAVSMLKEILMCVSIYALIKCIITPERKQALSWFFNRVMWMFLAEGSKLVLAILLFGVTQAISAIASANSGILALLPFDALLVFGMVYIVKNAPRLLQKLVASLGADGQGALRAIGNFTVGKQSFSDIMDNFRNQDQPSDQEESNVDDVVDGEIQSKISDIKDSDTDSEHDDKESQSDLEDIDTASDEEADDKDLDIEKELSAIDKEKADEEKEQDEQKEDSNEKQPNEKSKVENISDDEAAGDEQDEKDNDQSKIDAVEDTEDEKIEDDKEGQDISNQKKANVATDSKEDSDASNINKIPSAEEDTFESKEQVEESDETDEMPQEEQKEIKHETSDFKEALNKADKEELDNLLEELSAGEDDEMV